MRSFLLKVFKLVFPELHERGRRSAGIPQQQQHCPEQQQPHAGVKGVVGDFVLRAQAIAAQLQSSHPRLQVQQQKRAAHDHTPHRGASVAFLAQQAHRHHQLHGKPDACQRQGEKLGQYPASRQKISRFVHAGYLLHCGNQEEYPHGNAQDIQQKIYETVVLHAAESTPPRSRLQAVIISALK